MTKLANILFVFILFGVFGGSALAKSANQIEIEYLKGSQPHEFIASDVTVYIYGMSAGQPPGANAINDKLFAVNACLERGQVVERLIQIATRAGGGYGYRDYLVTCK